MGAQSKQAEIAEGAIIEQIALDKIAGGHAIHFINAVINPEITRDNLEKVASTNSAKPIGDTGYNYGDFEDLELCATKTAKISGIMEAVKATGGLLAQIGKKKAGKGLDAAKATIQSAKGVMKKNMPTAYGHVSKNKKRYGAAAIGTAGYTAGKVSN